MRRIFLIGYMCSGKSTLGRAVADIAGARFVDLDQAIEQRAGMPIADIFASQGEAAFRRLERGLLAEICASPKKNDAVRGEEMHGASLQSGDEDTVIVACGGGLPCQPGAMDQMRACGQTVWLRPSPERLIDRLMEGQAKRPLLRGIASREEMAAFAERMQAERAPYYAQANAQFDSSLLETAEEIAATAQLFATQFLACESELPTRSPR